MADKDVDYDEEDEEEEVSDDESQDEEDTGLTDNQNRLLYMLDLYTHKVSGAEEKSEWIRKPSLIVMIYEGIVAGGGILDYDYAPSSECIENRRIYLNVSQEGKSDVEFLREEELLNGLQVSSKSFRPITCYQISDKGKELVKRIPRKEKEAVHEFVYAKGTRELLNVRWDGIDYYLESSSGYSRKSTITDCEDVSYVSSAYIPQCLRYGGRPTLSNAHRAHESGANTDSLRDELDEVITLNSVSIIVAEYIPFGANQIVQLNNNLGSTERCQGGFISPFVDDGTNGSSIEMSPELTSVDILDYTLTNHINFEADINFAEEEGVIQVETFGCSLNAEGTCFYGMQIEAVMDRIKDNISLDHLSRLLVDVQQDSSAIVDSIVSGYQRQLLQLIFLGDAENRNKINLIIANEITPHLSAEEYMDKGEYENELRQVIGDTKAAYDISEHDTLIFGAGGLLVAGPNSRHHEPLLCAYLQFITIDIFVQNYYARLWILNDDMATTNQIIEEHFTDPKALGRIRGRLTKLAKDIIHLEEILGFLLEALDIIEIPPEPPEQAGRNLYERLEISGMRAQLVRRTQDLKKNIAGASRFLEILREMSSVVSEIKMFYLNEALENNTNKMCVLQEANEKSCNSLRILQYMYAGIFAFSVLHKLSGDFTVMDSTWFAGLAQSLIYGLPYGWFAFNIILWGIFFLFVKWIYDTAEYQAKGLTIVKYKVDRMIFMDKLREILINKKLSLEEEDLDDMASVKRITYEEIDKREWGGFAPIITLDFDEKNKILRTIIVKYNRRKADQQLVMNSQELIEKIFDEFTVMQLWDEASQNREHQDLAMEKREKIGERIRKMEEIEEKGGAEEEED